MKALFDRYLSQKIGLNRHTAYHIDEATLTVVADTYFGAVGAKDGVTHYYPYSSRDPRDGEGGRRRGGRALHPQARVAPAW